MKLFCGVVFCVLLALSTVAPAFADKASAMQDLRKLKASGVGDDTLVAYIKSRNEYYDLSATEILELRDRGFSSIVLNAMLASGRASVSVSPNPVPPAAVSTLPASTPLPAVPAPAVVPTTPTVPFAPSVSSQPVVTVPGVPAPPNNNPDVAYFHQELSPYGRWILGEDGLLYWQPTVAVSAPGWRPYVDRGHWMWTDHGWYWVSDYPWGWAAFHYGRWHLHPHHGWIWLPDRLWGPAWVVWRSGGDHCGWAPLPPGAVYDTAGGYFVFRGRRVEAGFDFGLGASHFTFRLVREFGEPMRWRPRNEVEIREVFSRTTVVHSYSVTRTGSGAESRVAVFNRGIEPAAGVGGRGHGLAPVHIQDLETPAPGRAHEHLDAHGRTLQVYRPRFGAHR